MSNVDSGRKFARFLGLVGCVVLAPWSAADAQTIRPSVTGVVTDSSGAVHAGRDRRGGQPRAD